MSGVLLFALLLAISFISTGVEAALLSLSPARVRHFARQQSKAAQRLERLLERPHRLLLSILVITNACNIGALALLIRFATERLGSAGYLAAGVTAIPLWLVLLGVVPKGLFRRMPFRTLSALVHPLEISTRLLDPVTNIFEHVAGPLVQASPGRLHSAGASRDELKFIAEASERAGELTPMERAMIHDVLDFRSLTAESVMIPWEKVVSVELDTPYEEIIRRAKTHEVDRMPVTTPEGGVAGLVLTLDVLIDGGQGKVARNFLRHIVRAPLREPAHKLIRRMRAARVNLAVVRDESGVLRGIVASEDLVARLVQNASAIASGPTPQPG